MLKWTPEKNGFNAYLKLEKNLSSHSIAAYSSDVQKFFDFLTYSFPLIDLVAVEQKHLSYF